MTLLTTPLELDIANSTVVGNAATPLLKGSALAISPASNAAGALATALRFLRARTSETGPQPVAHDGDLPLSSVQEQFWLFQQLYPESTVYTIPYAFRLQGALNCTALAQALHAVQQRHAILRTTYHLVADQPVQRVTPDQPWVLAQRDLRSLPEAERQLCLQEQTEREAKHAFDLSREPGWRCQLVQLTDSEFVLLLTLHHIAYDAASERLLFAELRSLYAAFCAGQPSPLAEPNLQYADYAVWQRQSLTDQGLAQQIALSRQRLGNQYALPDLPVDSATPAAQHFVRQTQRQALSVALSQALRNFSSQAGVSLFTTLLGAFAVLCYRYSSQEQMLLGIHVSNRQHAGLNKLIGVFINLLALPVDLGGNPTFRQLLAQIEQATAALYAYPAVPLDKVLRGLPGVHSASADALVLPVTFNMPPLRHPFALPGITVEDLWQRSVVDHADLFFNVWPEEQSLTLYVAYNADRFSEQRMTRLLGHYQTLLTAIVATPAPDGESGADQPINQLPLLTAAERRQILVEWNNTQTAYPTGACAAPAEWQSTHALFAAQAMRTPHAVAAVFGEQQITYDALHQRSNRWAWQLIEHGLQPGAVVALVADRSIDFLTALLATLKAGAVYLPCDPTYPTERLTQILQQSQATLILSEHRWRPMLTEIAQKRAPTAALPLLCLEALEQSAAPARNLPRRAPDDLAYVIYTSGSTGVQKGAMVHQQGMLNHLYAMISELTLTAADHVAQNAAQTFDISIWQFLVAGLVGGTVHILTRETASDPTRLLTAIEQQALTIVELVPSLLREMMLVIEQQGRAAALKTVRWLIPTGEALPPELARQWLTLYPAIPLMNAYGPAECSDDVTCYPITTPPDEAVLNMPIGRPVANLRVYILDANRQPLPIGIPGELYIGGAGVGLGYLNDAERTRQAFFPDPFVEQAGARLYKTGDLARWLPDGNIEYLGRVDYQVKLRGFRIELGEIETVLTQHAAVREAVVIAHIATETLGAGEKRLVAYVTLTQPLDDTATVLRSWLKTRLPDYMLPTTVIGLEKLPLSPNGKIDRKALIARPLDADPFNRKNAYVPPRDGVELRLVQRWEKLLGLASLGVQDNFFEVGGDSLLAIRLVANIHQEFGIKIPLQVLFQSGTIEQLATLLRQDVVPTTGSPLVCLQPQGTQAPLFCVHGSGGIVFSYLQVAALLGKERPFYGIQARGVEPGEAFYASIEEMAATYVDAVRVVQPKGPYLLSGWSMGGTVAFAMARILEQAGETVPFLLMLDAPSPFIDFYAEDDDTFLLERLHPAAGLAQHAVDEHAARAARLTYLFNEQRLADLLTPEIDRAYAQHRLNLHQQHNKILCQYRPAGAIHGKIIFLKATEASPFAAKLKNPTVDWARFALGGLEVRDTPGNHFNLFSPLHSPVLAQKMQACIDAFDL